VKTLVITGATDGMGRALAETYLRRGDTVVAIGRDPDKGAAIEAAGGRFLPADLSRVDDNRRVLADITAHHPSVDAIVLCARHFRSTRRTTTDGFEHTFALEYLSRFLFSHELTGPLRRAPRPVIVNVSGPGVLKPDIHWNDIHLTRNYSGLAAQHQAGRANDLLAIAYATNHATKPASYVLLNPGAVATSFSGQYDTATAAHVERLNATPSAEHVLHHQFYRHPAVRHARTGRATSREPAVIRGAVAPSR
jgi:NAD(P)-dependent dehydrogenase (short-subunit alcohol dehydrogenase family)